MVHLFHNSADRVMNPRMYGQYSHTVRVLHYTICFVFCFRECHGTWSTVYWFVVDLL